MKSSWATQHWKILPLTDDDWAKLEEPFKRRTDALAILRKLREWKNVPVTVDWIHGRAESIINSMNTTLKSLDMPYKLVNSHGRGSRATRSYFTQIHSIEQ